MSALQTLTRQTSPLNKVDPRKVLTWQTCMTLACPLKTEKRRVPAPSVIGQVKSSQPVGEGGVF